jgi:6-phosphogluconate dehydrogenase
MKDQRVSASSRFDGPVTSEAFTASDRELIVDSVADALHASRICSYAQGMALIAAGSAHYDWHVNLSEMARIWKGGCIIRARVLDDVRAAFTRDPALVNLLMDERLGRQVQDAQAGWRRIAASAVAAGIPIPAMTASLAYFDSYRTARLPQNLTQAQRDAFGAHTFERIERPGFIHADWGLRPDAD